MLKRSLHANLSDSGFTLVVIALVASSCRYTWGQTAQSSDNRGVPAPTTICDLFKNLESHREKAITVTGIYWNGLREVCSGKFVAGGYARPTALNLVDSDFMTKFGEPVTFKTDRESWDRLDKLVIREAKARHREEIWITVTGKLQTIETQKDGRVVGGFGHLGVFPAQLVVERISNIEIKSVPTYDYGEILRGLHQ